MVGINTVNILH
ncbi:hypothetical protein AZE42_13938, partial [Rhizopogon vesiculosus]